MRYDVELTVFNMCNYRSHLFWSAVPYQHKKEAAVTIHRLINNGYNAVLRVL